MSNAELQRTIARTGDGADTQSREQWAIPRLSKLLQRFPSWPRGHLLLAESALLGGDIALAYGSAQAARALFANGAPGQLRADRALGRCYLRRGVFETALAIFEKLRERGCLDADLCEDIAACHFPRGDFSAVESALMLVPEAELSQEGQAMLHLARARKGGPQQPQGVVPVSSRSKGSGGTDG